MNRNMYLAVQLPPPSTHLPDLAQSTPMTIMLPSNARIDSNLWKPQDPPTITSLLLSLHVSRAFQAQGREYSCQTPTKQPAPRQPPQQSRPPALPKGKLWKCKIIISYSLTRLLRAGTAPILTGSFIAIVAIRISLLLLWHTGRICIRPVAIQYVVWQRRVVDTVTTSPHLRSIYDAARGVVTRLWGLLPARGAIEDNNIIVRRPRRARRRRRGRTTVYVCIFFAWVFWHALFAEWFWLVRGW